ncbi:hypothetical protein [Maribellus maritimus]|uniref:hypothetical protein n=1 Tax=Maribellus maritimus TaxID=2870838 RepID=UPI001EEC0EEE|nr:hypothetical protein [Maribellus maritimus]MCG6191322.1 hypothetical protein [Maribellus maritimus]
MKTMINSFAPEHKSNLARIQFGNQELSDEIKIVDFLEETQQGQYVISLYSELFSGSSIKVFMRNSKVVLFITEYVESANPTAVYVSDWQNFYPQSYSRMRSVSLVLPGDNFFLLRHFLVPEKYLLKILLGQLTEN